MKIVVALDLSSHALGMAVYSLSDKEVILEYSEQFEVVGDDFGVRLVDFEKYIFLMFEKWKPCVVSTENPSTIFRMAPWTGKMLAQLLGVLRLNCVKRGIALVEVNPGSAKYTVSKNGRAKKPEVVKSVQKLFPEQNVIRKEEDRADAIAIGINCVLEHVKGYKKPFLGDYMKEGKILFV
jgi:Holliday junction resolvasome RuvABC endonuclease subunit